jgi:hypothetical protein
MINELFNNIYSKIIIVIILSLLLTFSHEIDVFKDGVIAYMIFAMLMLLIFTKDNMGYIIMIGALFILTYNNVIHKKSKE